MGRTSGISSEAIVFEKVWFKSGLNVLRDVARLVKSGQAGPDPVGVVVVPAI